MGTSKHELFSPFQNELARMAKALGHPARIAILEHLILKGECVCGDIVDKIPLAQATISQHLKAMKEAGIVKGITEGPYKCYCADITKCQQLLQGIKAIFEKGTNCC